MNKVLRTIINWALENFNNILNIYVEFGMSREMQTFFVY